MAKVTNQEVIKSVEAEVNPLVEQIKAVEIKDNDSYIENGGLLNDIKAKEKLIKSRKEDITKPLNEALKSARDLFRPVEGSLAEAKTILGGKLNSFKREQDKIAAEKARKLQEKIEKGTIKKPETIMKNLDKIEKADTVGAGLAETTRKVVTIDPKNMTREYVGELIKRPGVWKAIEVEIRKDALGNKAQGIEPRIEAGIAVTEEKVVF